MRETEKMFQKRCQNGDFDNILVGKGIDVGSGIGANCAPLVAPKATVIPWDLPEGDAMYLETIEDGSLDFVYSSHCLEHMHDVECTIKHWIKKLRRKPEGSWLYIVVPDYTLYEKLCWPSMYNWDHKHSFSLQLSREKIGRHNHWTATEILAAISGSDLSRHVTDFQEELEDQDYDYSAGPKQDQTLFPMTVAQIVFKARLTPNV